MKTTEFVLRGGTLVDATTDGTPMDLLIREGKIAAQLARQGLADMAGAEDADFHFCHLEWTSLG